MNASGNRSCDEKERVAEAGRTELTQAAGTRRRSPGTGHASAQPGVLYQSTGLASSISLARRTGPDARGLSPR